MIFIKGDKIDLHMFPDGMDWSSLLNSPACVQGSRLGAFPITKFKTSDSNNLILAIVIRRDKANIGRICIEDINYINRTGELKIIIDDEYHKKGYGKEACRLIIQHAFNLLNLNRIYLGTFITNVGMQKLAESLGFKQEGVRRNATYKNGEYLDIVEYGLLKEEFNAGYKV